MSVNNFEQIRPLLDFRSRDDFYFLQILQRKKDHKNGQKVNGTNNNSRLVKAYYINSIEYFDFIMPEVITLCEVFNARAGINLNRRSFEKMALQNLKKCTDQIINGDYHKAYKAYSSVVGAYSNETDKNWIIDIDVKDEEFVRTLWGIVESIRPFDKKKEITTLPSKNGFHMISRPFDLKEFKQYMFDRQDIFPETPEVHRNNPTNLYIP